MKNTTKHGILLAFVALMSAQANAEVKVEDHLGSTTFRGLRHELQNLASSFI